jgi:hypothetical protein
MVGSSIITQNPLSRTSTLSDAAASNPRSAAKSLETVIVVAMHPFARSRVGPECHIMRPTAISETKRTFWPPSQPRDSPGLGLNRLNESSEFMFWFESLSPAVYRQQTTRGSVLAAGRKVRRFSQILWLRLHWLATSRWLGEKPRFALDLVAKANRLRKPSSLKCSCRLSVARRQCRAQTRLVDQPNALSPVPA